MANSLKNLLSKLSIKKLRAKHPKAFNRTFLGLFIAGIAAGIIAFAVLLGIDPYDNLNKNSFIGFLVFALICVIAYLLWLVFGPQNKKSEIKDNDRKTDVSRV